MLVVVVVFRSVRQKHGQKLPERLCVCLLQGGAVSDVI